MTHEAALPICHACGKATNPYVDFDRAGPVRRCGNVDCRATLKDAPQPAVDPVPHAPAVPRVANAPAPRLSPVAVPADVTADSMVAALRDRLAVVKVQLAAMAKLKDEEARLERMLSAAEEPAN